MNECIYCKKRDPQTSYCDSSPNDRHKLRVVPFDEQFRTTLVGNLVGGIWRLRIAGIPVGKIFIIGGIALFIALNYFGKDKDKDSSKKAETTIPITVEKENKTTSADASITESKKNWLIIEGKDIWVRSAPSAGEVIMKLNSGDKCEVLEKGKFEEIRNMYDYWYEIKYNGQIGWVYGSQSNLKTNYSYSDAVEKGLIKP